MLKIIQKFLDSRQRQKEDDFFWQNNNFRFLSGSQIRYILDIIQEEVAVSAKFGLIIQLEHLFNEKFIILTVFNQWGQALNKIGKRDNVFLNHYERTERSLSDLIFNLLSDETKYYFDHALPGEVKNRYN